jgi:pyruvate dehydrogenase E2 component (dihydrolipoamide acetyltransferase)
MATALKMPQLGMTMTEAKLVRWLKREGDEVRKGEPVAEIETDKLNAEVEANADGVLRKLVASEGDTIKVVGLLGVIASADESDASVNAIAGATPAAAPTRGAASQASAASPQQGFAGSAGGSGDGRSPAGPGEARQESARGSGGRPGGQTRPPDVADGPRASPIAKKLAADLGVDLSRVSGSGPSGRIVEADVRAAALPAPSSNGHIKASPLAKRLAREHELDLVSLTGTGPDGRIVERDILSALEALPSPAVGGLTPREAIPLSGMRRVIADRMHASLQEMAQLTLTTEADVTPLVELRSHLVPAAKVYGHRAPSYTDLIVHIVARTLRSHPFLNASLTDNQVVAWNEIHIGVAVALDRGLLVPVIQHADRKPLQTISEELGDLAERARANRLTPDELQGGTFTITNLGLQEIDAFTPIVNPPQCAILGVGRIAKKPAVYQDQLAIRHLVTLSLSFDHRVVDGAPAGAFLRDVKRALEAAQLEDAS